MNRFPPQEKIMMSSHLSEATARGLPPRIRAAQAAIPFPEVQDMLRRQSEYDLGICMPHMQDELTGNFAPLRTGVMQVESGLKVSFEPADDVAERAESCVPMGWAWRDGGAGAGGRP
jgi:hypothetical protein